MTNSGTHRGPLPIDAELQADVDAQLLERGAYTALEWLIESGRLAGADYEAWRRGEIEFLDSTLMGDGVQVRSQLESAARYALTIGLVGRLQDFDGWSAQSPSAGRALRASSDPALHALIASRYAPAVHGPQMDLFFDNPVVAVVNGLVRTLSARELGESRRQLDRLYALAPTHADLAGFDRLSSLLERVAQPVEDLREEIDLLAELRPTAQRLLGFQARDLLVPAWRRIAAAAAGGPYDAAVDELHTSFALAEAGDWGAACDAVLAEPRWPRHAALCARLALAAYQDKRRSVSLGAWMHLCWRSPPAAAAALEARGNPDAWIVMFWRRFLECAETLALDPQAADETELGPAEFPAWLLLQEPALTLQLPASLTSSATPAEHLFRLVHDWVRARRAKAADQELALRPALRTANPSLFRELKRVAAAWSEPQ